MQFELLGGNVNDNRRSGTWLTCGHIIRALIMICNLQRTPNPPNSSGHRPSFRVADSPVYHSLYSLRRQIACSLRSSEFRSLVLLECRTFLLLWCLIISVSLVRCVGMLTLSMTASEIVISLVDFSLASVHLHFDR